ncbi:N-acetylmuramoyl-L-alanine amidase [Rhodobaculum claviforme]|uniref:N-acetylmuramoyl-L-alanine amidase n=1 Tax=Rhodobaculum claviforme TaxID=1549854 RepID=A0A934TML2_9RHOB|nr:N-acetylmuramoyl-L-alanine amidase [Rhodobaculum claviforme]MBK5928570.1 N-acetylmuramoyl-L-alanine amidase [Rhodobaculum claviforme]
MVVVHFTGMRGCADALARLCDPAAEVSAHYLIDSGGTVLRLVPEALRAWHAGAGAWGAVGDVNSRSIGIELVNPGDVPFAAPQMAALEGVLAGILARWSVPPERVIGHACMAPERKVDPGPRFDWRRLARAGLSVWPEGAGAADPAGFAADARRFGYPRAAPDAVLAAFRARFRPRATGPVSEADAGIMAALARRWPVDLR